MPERLRHFAFLFVAASAGLCCGTKPEAAAPLVVHADEPSAAPVVPGVPSSSASGVAAPDPSPPPDHPFRALMTKNNRWRYRMIDGWHSSNRSAQVQTETVERVQQLGKYWVAHVKVEGGTHEPKRWVATDLKLWISSEEWGPWATEVDVEKALVAAPSYDASRADSPTVLCVPAGCFGAAVASRDISTDRVWFHPGVGLLAWTDGWYSVDTGDGGARHAFLVSFEGPAGASHIVTEAEPADARDVRLRVLAAAKAGRLPRAADVDPEVMFSLNGEHMNRDAAFASWKTDGNLAMNTLAVTLREPCKLVNDRATFLACPTAFAETLATTKSIAPLATGPRAVFTKATSGWRLSALLLGGEDDIYSKPEWSSDPPLPSSLQDRFAPPGKARP